jgi:hypothetical protein
VGASKVSHSVSVCLIVRAKEMLLQNVIRWCECFMFGLERQVLFIAHFSYDVS